MHVLVIDELADLVAYGDAEDRREANRLLARLLTKGRALGVVVVAFVQDPRKDVVAMRNLFTQRVALRLLSVEETTMVLGDGAARTAPAHRISPTAQGMAWVVDDAGNTDRVRADYWPDDTIRDLATGYPATVRTLLPTPAADQAKADDDADADGYGGEGGSLRPPPARPAGRTPRAPRARSPRASTRTTGTGTATMAAGAAAGSPGASTTPTREQ